ncbi:5-methylcytosine restriction system specificity protein McrC [Mycoplasma phocoeninasale]|uniref:5-methylcytosine restriction system specificity protein McrC n=1 Tax=Mycoplasma phocoeninasale TaxID=2726117 RepID=UPI0019686095|nr:hypothetical protein [Mycoplasma phocoeninasale]MBN0970541.1 hypothetical protein [Mycoplasma phocoeninasale]
MKKLKDNREIKKSEHFNFLQSNLFKRVANKTLKHLKESENFIIFPGDIDTKEDDKKFIFRIVDDKAWTGNIVGWLADNETKININSRFSSDDNDDYFLHYLILKNMKYSVNNQMISSDVNYEYYNILLFLFPYFLNQALKKGLYKKYIANNYNDHSFRGIINFVEHIKTNLPFNGKIAYQTRDFSYENDLNMLIRHTIEKIQKTNNKSILTNNLENIKNINLIKTITPNYSAKDLNLILNKNIKNKLKHRFFVEYADLQELCIHILTNKKTSYGLAKRKINGIIIDIAILWENYIASITTNVLKHLKYKESWIYLFNKDSKNQITNGERKIYPDFILDNRIPIDAKYKETISKRDDYYQLISYLHVLGDEEHLGELSAYFIKPNLQNSGIEKIGELKGLGGSLYTYNFFIPKCDSFDDFKNQMEKEEHKLVTHLQQLIGDDD